MELLAGSDAQVVFLLVDDSLRPVTGASPSVELSFAGGGFDPLVSGVLEVGNGWYSVVVPVPKIPGPVVFVARADGAQEWRDIHSVVLPGGEDVAASVRNEMERWTAVVAAPIRFVRIGASN